MGGSKGGGGPSGTTTSVQNTEPWGPQQGYLKEIFNAAKQLYENYPPQYYPGSTYATPNLNQTQGFDTLGWQARVDTLPDEVAAATGQIARGDFLHSNPAESLFSSFANGGVTNPSLSLYGSIAGGAITNPSLADYASIADGAISNPSVPGYRSVAGGDLVNPALARFGALGDADNAISGYLGSYLNGSRLGADNPFTKELTGNILSKVVPQIQSQFISSGTLPSAEAARATAAGATSALAPYLFQQQQQEEANQMAAAGKLAESRLAAATGQGNVAQGDAATRLAGLSGLSSASNADVANRLAALSGLSGTSQSDVANRLAALAGLSSGSQSDTANRLSATTGLSNTFESNLNDMLRSIALAPGADALKYGRWQTLTSAGAGQQQLDQQAINDAVTRWNWQQELPFNQLNNYIGAVTGNYGGTTALTQPYFKAPQPSVLSQVGQGVGTAASLFGLFGGSDRRMKDDIKKVGKLDNGLTVYSYRYKDDPGEMKHIGVMADEVEDVHPEAVSTLPPAFGHLAGFKVVDYGRATA